MVKVREDQPLTESGKVDIQQWLTRLQEDVRLREPERLLEACELAEQLEREAPRTHRVWLSPGSSFRMGLEMADILADLKLDQATLEAAVLYRAVREGLLSLEGVSKRFGEEVAKLIDGVLQMAAISYPLAPNHGMSQHNQQENLMNESFHARLLLLHHQKFYHYYHLNDLCEYKRIFFYYWIKLNHHQYIF